MPLNANLLKLESSILTRAKRATNRNNVATINEATFFFGWIFSGGIFSGGFLPRTLLNIIAAVYRNSSYCCFAEGTCFCWWDNLGTKASVPCTQKNLLYSSGCNLQFRHISTECCIRPRQYILCISCRYLQERIQDFCQGGANFDKNICSNFINYWIVSPE